MCEAFVDGDYQFLDIDQQTFYLDLENGKPVNGNAVARDHYLAKRELAYGPLMTNWSIGEKAAALFGRDDGSLFRAVSGHRMDYRLRPGESVEYRWDNVGKFPSDDSEGPMTRSYWGNSLWVFEPRLTEVRFREDAAEFAADHVTYEMSAPYPLCGGRVEAVFRAGDTGPARISVSLDKVEWREAWAQADGADTSVSLAIDEYLDYKSAPPKYSYFIRVQAPPMDITHLRFESDLMASPLSLPRLRTGANEIVYTDETTSPREVTITHQWRESGASVLPLPPERPLFPADGTIVRETTFAFRWAPVAGADLYHLEVSRHRDMRYAFRPSFDVFVDATTHGSPFAGLFNPEEEYFWRVKARNTDGLWGEWSPVWSFQWDGPRVPVNLNAEFDQHGVVLHWKPNPRGAQAVRYEVYGSDEKGFTPSKTPYDVLGLGRQPANLLGTTAANQLRIVADGAENPAMNRTYYRVVAIDSLDVASGPSTLLELPHPHIYSRPVTVAKVGRPYEYRVRTLASLGDLQQRYVEPGAAFWEKEGYEFELVRGPAWLTMDPETGVLRGSPSAADIGSGEVVLVVHRTFPFEQKRGTPSARFFQKIHAMYRDEDLQRFQLHVE